MNYIELINNFWKTRRTTPLSSTEADLYFFLLQESNLRDWENPFFCANGIICATIGISEKALIDVRNRLQQKGLISFEAGQKRKKAPSYTLFNCSKVSKGVSKEVGKRVSKRVSKDPNIILNKTETETKLEDNTPLPPKGESEKTWKNDFDVYKSELKEAYVALRSDESWILKQQGFNPSLDILKTLEKAHDNYWSTEGAWDKKRREKIKTVNWKSTLTNAVSSSLNKVYKEKQGYKHPSATNTNKTNRENF